jgi:hypothetical protein
MKEFTKRVFLATGLTVAVVGLIVFDALAASAATITLTPVYSGSFSGDGSNTSLGIIPNFQHQIGEILEFDVYMDVNNLLSGENFSGVAFNISTNANLAPVDTFGVGALWYSPAQGRGVATSTDGPYKYRTFPNNGVSSGSPGQPLKSYNSYRGDTTTTASTPLFNTNFSTTNDLNNIVVFAGRIGTNGKIDAFNRDYGQVFNPTIGQGLGEPDQLRAAGSADTLIGSFFVQYVNDDGTTDTGKPFHAGALQIVPSFADSTNTTWTTLRNNSAAGGGTQQNYFGANYNVPGVGTFFGGSVFMPEPTSVILMGPGGLAILIAARRRIRLG